MARPKLNGGSENLDTPQMEQEAVTTKKQGVKSLEPKWDKWRVEATALPKRNPDDRLEPKKYELRLIVKERTAVVVEENSIELLNVHAHSTLRYYTPTDTHNASDVITVEVY